MTSKLTLLLVTCALAVALAATPASAIVDPVSCGTTTVNGKRYQIKVDQITCAKGKPYAREYLRTRRKPTGYRCTNYPSSSKFKFICRRGDRTFLAIKR